MTTRLLVALLLTCSSTLAATNAPAHIVSYSPAITEIFFAIGAGDQLVGVSDFCDYPAAAQAVQRIGGVINPSFEVLITLEPDVVVVQGGAEKMKRFCETHGIRLVAVCVDDLQTITNTIQALGELTGHVNDATCLRALMVQRLNGLEPASADPPPGVFVCLGRAPGAVSACTTVSAGSFIDQMLAAAGGSNICADVVGSYPTVAAEVLTARAPDVIFDLKPNAALSAEDRTTIENEWQTIVPQARVVVITNQGAMIPGPRVVELAEEFARGLTETNGAVHAE